MTREDALEALDKIGIVTREDEKFALLVKCFSELLPKRETGEKGHVRLIEAENVKGNRRKA